MPRRARLDAPGTLHHVMIRGIEGKGIFRDTQDPKDVVTRLGDLSKQTGTRGKMVDGVGPRYVHEYTVLMSQR